MSLVLLAAPFSRRGTSLQRWLFSVALEEGLTRLSGVVGEVEGVDGRTRPSVLTNLRRGRRLA